MSAKAELFAIRCSINQATCLPNVNWIFIIMNYIHITRRIFDLSLHLYQIHTASISYELREFFKKDSNNLVEFWNCPSNQKWSLHNIVNKETKKFDITLIHPYKLLWDFSRKNKCDTILNTWKMSF